MNTCCHASLRIDLNLLAEYPDFAEWSQRANVPRSSKYVASKQNARSQVEWAGYGTEDSKPSWSAGALSPSVPCVGKEHKQRLDELDDQLDATTCPGLALTRCSPESVICQTNSQCRGDTQHSAMP